MQLKEIGVIRSPFSSLEETPKRGDLAKNEGRIELHPAYAEGLKDLEGFSHAYVLCFLDNVTISSNVAYPPQDGQKRGVFATRSPHRPNPVSLTRVRIQNIENNVIHVEGLDMLDGTPVIDIKPYTGRIPKDPTFGWLEER